MLSGDFPLALPLGTVLAGQYEIDGILGQGGFGITYRAHDHRTGGKVAIKEFFPDSLAARTGGTTVSAFSGDRSESFEYGRNCFLKEAETLAQFIGNENIVRVISYFEENGTAYYVMEFIEGMDFDEYIKQRGGKISFEEASRVLVPIMEALGTVHKKGVIHRDVTPDNIFITNDGIPKLIDFGAARYSLGDKSQSLDVVLKHGFAPKEQYTRRGRQGPYTDVYSLGASFYFAVTGKKPPDAIERIDEDDLIAPSARGIHIPREAEDAIMTALNLQPAERFQSMEEFERALLGPKTLSGRSNKTEAYPPEGPGAGHSGADRTVAVPRDTGDAYSNRKKRKKSNLPLVIAAILAVVIIALIAVAAVRLISTAVNKTAGKNTEAITNDEAEDDTGETASEGLLSDGGSSVTEGSAGSADSSDADTVDEELTADDLTFPEIIGNTAANLMNCCHFGPQGEFMKSDGTICMCLSRIGDTVYYLDNLKGGDMVITTYDVNTGEKEVLSDLPWEVFTADRLLVSKAYYFVHTYGDKKMYCISRSDGKIKNSCDIEDPNLCTFYKGSFYYITPDEGGQYLNSNPAGELDAGDHVMYSVPDEEGKITFISASDDGMILLMEGDGNRFKKIALGDDGSNEVNVYECDYEGQVNGLVPFGSDIYFTGKRGDGDEQDIVKYDMDTRTTTIIKTVSSRFNLSINVNEIDGERKIGFMIYPESAADGDPYCALMTEKTGELKKTDLPRYAD